MAERQRQPYSMGNYPWRKADEEEKKATKTQPNMAERQRRHQSVQYYQRSRTEEFSPKGSETAAMDKGKVKPPGGARRESGIPYSQQNLLLLLSIMCPLLI